MKYVGIMKMTDDELYKAFLQGDMTAIDELMLRYRQSLMAYLLSYTHDENDAEDLLMEGFANLLAKRPGIGAGKVRAYLFKTARNAALKELRRKNRLDFETDPEAIADLAAAIDTPEEQFLKRARHEALAEHMQKLPAQTAEALHLVYIQDLSYEEAARVMKISTKKLDNILYTGKQKLREQL